VGTRDVHAGGATPSDGKRIGLIRLEHLRAPCQQPRHHVLDLFLGGPAIADRCQLDGPGGVFSQLKPRLPYTQDQHTAKLTQDQGGAGAMRYETFLDDDQIGARLIQDSDQALVSQHKPVGQGQARVKVEGSAGDVPPSRPGPLHDTVAQPPAPRIDPQDPCRSPAHCSRADPDCAVTALSAAQFLEQLGRNVEIGPDLLHIIVILENIHDAEDLLGLLLFGYIDRGLRYAGEFR